MNPTTARTIAITGMNAKPDNPGPGLAVARSLRQAYGDQIRLIAMSYDVLDPGLYLGQYCDAAYLLPYPSAGEQALWQRLSTIQAKEEIDTLIPCLDAELLSFIRLRDALESLGIRMFLPSREQLLARNKDRLGELTAQVGIQYPETIKITQADFFHQCQNNDWSYPLMVKGIFYDAMIVNNPTEGVTAFHKIAAEWGLPVLVQKHACGHEVNLVGLGDGQGNLLGPVMMRKQAVTDKGKAWSGITIRDEQLENMARKLVAALNWAGPLEVEILKEAGSHQPLLLEINPRFPAWIYLATAAGVNLPAALVDLIWNKHNPLPAPAIGRMMIRYAQETVIDLQTFEAMTMAGSYTPLAPTPATTALSLNASPQTR